ncbi:PF04463 domain protein, partial [Schaalia georgiae F0490]
LRGTARVVTEQGADVTAEFVAGARRVADEAVARGACAAVLQPRSPSCGCGRVYDGSFSGRLVDGDGVLAAALRARGIGVRALTGS